MYGVPLPPQPPTTSDPQQGVATSQAKPPMWGGQGYMDQYNQQRQQIQQQLAGLQQPNAPMPGQGMPPGGPPGMADGGMMTMSPMVGQQPVHGALNFAGGGTAGINGQAPTINNGLQNITPTGMMNVQQQQLPPVRGVPNGPALVPQTAQAASPLGQNGVPTGLYQPRNDQAILANTPSAENMSNYQRGQGIFTADQTPQYFSHNGNTQLASKLGAQGQSPGSPPLTGGGGSAAGDLNQQLTSMLGQQVPGMQSGGDVDFTGGGQPIDYNAGRKKDTIPAMLDHGEYVFTRKAVQGIGGGDIKVGGQILGALMRHFESKT